MSSHPRRRAPHVLGASAIAVSLAIGGCGVRFDTPPPPLPSPDAAETARQAAAQRATQIATLAESLPDPASEELAPVAAASRQFSAALGGVWAPPDWATPSSTPVAPEPSPSQPATDDVARALGTAAELTCKDAVALEVPATAPGEPEPDAPAASPAAQADAEPTAADPAGPDRADVAPGRAGDLVTLLASICLAQRHQAARLGVEIGELTGRPDESGRPAALAAALAGSAGALGLARALDAAGYALEVAAARSTGPSRPALAARARDHRALAGVILDAVGALGTAGDPRRAAYALTGPEALDPGAVEADVLAAWTAVVASAPPPSRAAVLAEMADTARLAEAWGRPPATFPGLPGLP